MRNLVDQVASYAAYHRDRRNIATHFIGIPAILMAVVAALSRPHLATIGTQAVSPALPMCGAVALFYLALDLPFGLAMLPLLAGSAIMGHSWAALALVPWAWRLGVLFVGGWILQLVGHWCEGRKPAFTDDLMSLLVGPLFLVVETALALGLRPDLGREIRDRAGALR